MEKKTDTFSKTGAVIAGICLAVLGILIFFFPLGSLLISTWLFVAGIGVYGVFNIVSYAKAEKGKRNSWLLVMGIILILLFFMMLPLYGEIKFFSNLSTIIFMLAFFSISNGINTLACSSEVAAAGGSKGLAILSGICSLLVGCFMIFRPFIAGIAEIYFLGAWLIFIAVSLIIGAFAKPKKD